MASPHDQRGSDDVRGYGAAKRQPFIQPTHWAIHHPLFDRHPKDLVVYMRLRTAFFEGDPNLKTMSTHEVAEICGVTYAVARDALSRMTQEGLLDSLRPRQRNAAPDRRFVDVPPDGHTGVLSGIDLRMAVLGERERAVTRREYVDNLRKSVSLENDTDSPRVAQERHETPSVSLRNDTVSLMNDTGPGISAGQTPNGDPPRSFYQEALSSKKLRAGAREERGKPPAAPAGSGTPRRLTAREAAQNAASALKGMSGGSTRVQVEERLEEAIQGGLPPSRAVDWLNGLITPHVRSAHRVHLANVLDLPDPEPADAYRWSIEMCTGCTDMGVALDPAYTSGKNGSVVCLHGQPPEPEAQMARRCSSCGRNLLPRSMDPCGRCRRTEG